MAHLVAIYTDGLATLARGSDSSSLAIARDAHTFAGALDALAVALVELAALSTPPDVLLGYQLVHHGRVHLGIGRDA